jgi:hypothetical protein
VRVNPFVVTPPGDVAVPTTPRRYVVPTVPENCVPEKASDPPDGVAVLVPEIPVVDVVDVMIVLVCAEELNGVCAMRILVPSEADDVHAAEASAVLEVQVMPSELVATRPLPPAATQVPPP